MNPREKRALNPKRTKGKRFRSKLIAELLVSVEGLFHKAVREELQPVREELDQVGRKLDSFLEWQRVSAVQITGSPARKFHLRFKTNPEAKSFSNTHLADEHGATICVMLIDANTGQLVTTGPEAVTKLEVVPLMGDFDTSEEQEWTAEEFERHVAKAREGRGPLLVGNLEVHLEKGEGILGQMSFTDNASWTRSKKFRLGVRVAEYGIVSVREGKSEAFSVLDIRGKEYRKYPVPSPTDDVWRLEHIRKDGRYHTKLTQNGILTVKDFLSCQETSPERLKQVMGRISVKKYREIIDHAKKCILADDDMADVAAAPQEAVDGSLVGTEPITGQDDDFIAECEDWEWEELLNSLIADPSPPAGRWCLRIRRVVRCVLFIRRARLARSL